jgi:hypothetical protein
VCVWAWKTRCFVEDVDLVYNLPGPERQDLQDCVGFGRIMLI